MLQERGPLPVAETVGYVLEACEAIAEAHAIGIVHRNLKPSNLFLSARRDGSPVIEILDFGISKLTRPRDNEASITGPSSVVGSPWYMSPEQPELQGCRRAHGHRAIGALLHEMITGSPPFDADTAAAVGARIATEEPSRLTEHRPDAPPELEAIVLRCLQKQPGKGSRAWRSLRTAWPVRTARVGIGGKGSPGSPAPISLGTTP